MEEEVRWWLSPGEGKQMVNDPTSSNCTLILMNPFDPFLEIGPPPPMMEAPLYQSLPGRGCEVFGRGAYTLIKRT